MEGSENPYSVYECKKGTVRFKISKEFDQVLLLRDDDECFERPPDSGEIEALLALNLEEGHIPFLQHLEETPKFSHEIGAQKDIGDLNLI